MDKRHLLIYFGLGKWGEDKSRKLTEICDKNLILYKLIEI